MRKERERETSVAAPGMDGSPAVITLPEMVSQVPLPPTDVLRVGRDTLRLPVRLRTPSTRSSKVPS